MSGKGPMSGGGNTVKEIHCHYCVVQLFFVTVIYIGSPSVLYARSTHTLIM